jgi:hypothetical protein
MARIKRALGYLVSSVFLAAGVAVATPLGAGAYGAGPANWQLAIAVTITAPTTLNGFGIWGWCDLAGAADRSNPTSGTAGDCQYAIYGHSGAGDVKCTVSVNVTSWGEGFPLLGEFFKVPADLYLLSGTQTITPGSNPSLCGPNGPIPTGPVPSNDLTPAKAGHYNGTFLLGFFGPPGAVGEIQANASQTP